MKDPLVTEFEELILCTCCERHKKKRPTHIGHLHQPYPIQSDNEEECNCTCRHRLRMICRELCGCTWIDTEPSEIQELHLPSR